jgi:hypothetical protein
VAVRGGLADGEERREEERRRFLGMRRDYSSMSMITSMSRSVEKLRVEGLKGETLKR